MNKIQVALDRARYEIMITAQDDGYAARCLEKVFDITVEIAREIAAINRYIANHHKP